MTEASETTVGKAPWHLWLVGILSVLWNLSGGITISLSQLGMLPNISEQEAAYYAGQPLWFEILTNIATWGAVVAGVLLLLRSRYCVQVYGVSLAMIITTHIADFAMGTSLVLTSTGAIVMSLVILVIACLQLFYTWRLTSAGILK